MNYYTESDYFNYATEQTHIDASIMLLDAQEKTNRANIIVAKEAVHGHLPELRTQRPTLFNAVKRLLMLFGVR